VRRGSGNDDPFRYNEHEMMETLNSYGVCLLDLLYVKSSFGTVTVHDIELEISRGYAEVGVCQDSR